ncbi:unnamed protein product [Pleuronectes platessa]|uniref:Uncharacterized protein n=1 Tax=Pleuronectes platessa TaxID=8262 RepID=A0A9N7YUC2_PLEPL|nr:unnamed protein product [Pleuronectes platessa]
MNYSSFCFLGEISTASIFTARYRLSGYGGGAAHSLCSRRPVSSDWHAQCVSWTDLRACVALLLKFHCQIPDEERVAGSAWLTGLSPPACLMKRTPSLIDGMTTSCKNLGMLLLLLLLLDEEMTDIPSHFHPCSRFVESTERRQDVSLGMRR